MTDERKYTLSDMKDAFAAGHTAMVYNPTNDERNAIVLFAYLNFNEYWKKYEFDLPSSKEQP